MYTDFSFFREFSTVKILMLENKYALRVNTIRLHLEGFPVQQTHQV